MNTFSLALIAVVLSAPIVEVCEVPLMKRNCRRVQDLTDNQVETCHGDTKKVLGCLRRFQMEYCTIDHFGDDPSLWYVYGAMKAFCGECNLARYKEYKKIYDGCANKGCTRTLKCLNDAMNKDDDGAANPDHRGQDPNPDYRGQDPNPDYRGWDPNPDYRGRDPNPDYRGQDPNPRSLQHDMRKCAGITYVDYYLNPPTCTDGEVSGGDSSGGSSGGSSGDSSGDSSKGHSGGSSNSTGGSAGDSGGGSSGATYYVTPAVFVYAMALIVTVSL